MTFWHANEYYQRRLEDSHRQVRFPRRRREPDADAYGNASTDSHPYSYTDKSDSDAAAASNAIQGPDSTNQSRGWANR